jgi:hypothetical protein
MVICRHVRSISLRAFREALNDAMGFSDMKPPSDFDSPKASSATLRLVSEASAQPSCVKYQSSTYSKFSSLLIAKVDGRGAIVSPIILFWSKPLSFGFFLSFSRLSASASCSFCICCRSSSSLTSLVSSSLASLSSCSCWVHAVFLILLSCVQAVTRSKVDCSSVICRVAIRASRTSLNASDAKSGQISSAGSRLMRGIVVGSVLCVVW